MERGEAGSGGAAVRSQGWGDQGDTVGFTEAQGGARTGHEQGPDGSVCGPGSRRRPTLKTPLGSELRPKTAEGW